MKTLITLIIVITFASTANAFFDSGKINGDLYFDDLTVNGHRMYMTVENKSTKGIYVEIEVYFMDLFDKVLGRSVVRTVIGAKDDVQASGYVHGNLDKIEGASKIRTCILYQRPSYDNEY
jgi:hypothetical protein